MILFLNGAISDVIPVPALPGMLLGDLALFDLAAAFHFRITNWRTRLALSLEGTGTVNWSGQVQQPDLTLHSGDVVDEYTWTYTPTETRNVDTIDNSGSVVTIETQLFGDYNSDATILSGSRAMQLVHYDDTILDSITVTVNRTLIESGTGTIYTDFSTITSDVRVAFSFGAGVSEYGIENGVSFWTPSASLVIVPVSYTYSNTTFTPTPNADDLGIGGSSITQVFLGNLTETDWTTPDFSEPVDLQVTAPLAYNPFTHTLTMEGVISLLTSTDITNTLFSLTGTFTIIASGSLTLTPHSCLPYTNTNGPIWSSTGQAIQNPLTS